MRKNETKIAAALLAFLGVIGASLAVPTASAQAATASYAGVGSQTVATPASGGRLLYVATNGTDSYKQYSRIPCLVDPPSMPPYQDACPEPTIDHPLRTVEAAIKAARPGDVIVVRAGVYSEAVGYGKRSGTVYKPLVLQSYPGERVEIHGTLIMSSPDNWTIRGIHFTYNSAIQKGQSVVTISGGANWTFTNNEVTGSTGVANVLINATTSSGSTAQLQAAAPRNFLISQNCIHDNRATGTFGTDHNIYLMSSVYSTGGVIERNLIAGAPRGANIKAAASSPSTAAASPKNVTIRYNTLLSAASGLTVGLSATGIETQGNLIALPAGSQKYDGAVKTYQLASPGKNSVKDSLLSGYAHPINEDYGATAHIFTARNATASKFTYTGSVANCTAKAADATIRAKYGQFAN